MFKLSLLPKVKRILLYLLQANDQIHWHSVFDLTYETLSTTPTTLCKNPWRVVGLLIIFSVSGFPVIIKFQPAACKRYLPLSIPNIQAARPQRVLPRRRLKYCKVLSKVHFHCHGRLNRFYSVQRQTILPVKGEKRGRERVALTPSDEPVRCLVNLRLAAVTLFSLISCWFIAYRKDSMTYPIQACRGLNAACHCSPCFLLTGCN